MYQMTTIYNGTRIRTTPTTAGAVLASVNGNVTVSGNELYTATQDLSNVGGIYQKVGDQWVKITYNGVTGWMAYIHMGDPICRDFKDLSTPPTEPPPAGIPDYFDLTAPDGTVTRYVKA